MWRLALSSLSVCTLVACLTTIDESKIREDGDIDVIRTDGGASGPRDAPETLEAEPPTVLPDGGLACSEGRTLCGDTCFDLSGEPAHCGACDVVCARSLVCRGSACRPPSSCKELLARWPAAPTGVHDLTIDGAVLPAYCDMTTDGGGFTLVLRISAGQKGDPYALFIGAPLNDALPEEVTPQVTQRHYVSRLLARWNVDFAVEEARARLVDFQGGLLREIAFDAKGSTRASWFAKDKVVASPWTDLGAATFFSAVGHADLQRRFFLHKPYSTCEEDEGWMIVHGSDASFCPYENPATNIRLYYAPNATAQRWNVSAPEASSFAIFVR